MKPENVENCAKNLIQNRPDLTYEQIALEVKRQTTESVSRSYIGVLARTMHDWSKVAVKKLIGLMLVVCSSSTVIAEDLPKNYSEAEPETFQCAGQYLYCSLGCYSECVCANSFDYNSCRLVCICPRR